MTNITIPMLIRSAYGLLYSNEDQITRLPPWAKSEHFDIVAKVSEEDAKLLKDETQEQRNAMLLAMLIDRFHMTAHVEIHDRPVFALVIAKGGSKMTEVKAHPKDEAVRDDAEQETGHGGWSRSDKEVKADEITMDAVVSLMTSIAEREVIDKTGLKETYSFTLKWTPDKEADTAGSTSGGASPPPFFTAVQEQLGLRLDAAKGPVRGVVVDHIEKPSDN